METLKVDKILAEKSMSKAIADGLKVYKKGGGSPSIERIENEKDLSSVDKVTIIRLAALLNLDEQQSKEIVKSYEAGKGRLTGGSSGILDSDGWVIDDYSGSDGSNTVLLDLLTFYSADRLYLLRSVNLILSHRSTGDEKSDSILRFQAATKGETLLDELDQSRF